MDILIVAAHPDDEVLGCGGSLARHAAAGDNVHILILADGVSSRDGGGDERAIAERAKAAAGAAKALGAQPPRLLGFPDNALDTVPLIEIIRAIEASISEFLPETVYTHHGGDLNIDHRIAHQGTVTACRPVPGQCVKNLYCFETVSSTEWATPAIGPAFRPNRYVDISGYEDAKRRALEFYDTEMRPFPHARSLQAVEALWRVRGSQAGLPAAEAFMIALQIDD